MSVNPSPQTLDPNAKRIPPVCCRSNTASPELTNTPQPLSSPRSSPRSNTALAKLLSSYLRFKSGSN